MAERISRQDIVERFCALADEVADRVFDWSEIGCFCGKEQQYGDWPFNDGQALVFIETATRDRMEEIKALEGKIDRLVGE